MTRLKKLSISQIVERLDRPFLVIDAARVGDIVVSVYMCQGMVEWHRHLDYDELFWVHEGTMLLESEWGEIRLRPGELAVVPKGIRHRSSSGLPASVLLLHCGFISDRKNGRRRLYAITGEAKLKHISLRNTTHRLASPFQFQTLAQIEDSVVQVAWGEGTWPVEIPVSQDELLFVLDGTATVRTSQSLLHLHHDDFTTVTRGTTYQLSTTQGTELVRVTRESVE